MRFHRCPALVAILWAVLLCASPPERIEGQPGEARARADRATDRTRTARLWPVDVPVHLSSSFGEFRDGHLHAGLDIRSFGREGIPCRAVDRGHISRLRASPFGYGKAVYLKLETGETIVYAHLSEFAPEIDSVVYAAQLRAQRYQVDIYPRPNDLPVRRGQIIGYTGRTGATAPHLHFEVRDADEHPVNPLYAGWELKDDAPPAIRRLECLPLSPESRVNGRCAPVTVDLHAVSPNALAAAETLRVSGVVGFGAEVIDRASSNSGNLAPYRVELETDGERLARIEMRSFSYDQTSEVELVYDIAEARLGGGHYILLFRRNGETLGHREFTNDGIITTDLVHEEAGGKGHARNVVVRATDFAGNVAEARCVVVEAPPAPAPPDDMSGIPVDAGMSVSQRSSRSRRSDELPGAYFFEGLMSVQGRGAWSVDTTVTRALYAGIGDSGRRAGGELVLSFDSIGEAGRTVSLRLDGSTRDIHLIGARPDAPFRRSFADLGVDLIAEAGGVYSNCILYITAWTGESAGEIPEDAGMRMVTPAVRLGPLAAVFKKSIEIRFVLGDGERGKLAVCRLDERKASWSFRPSSRDGGVSAFIREPGVYAVFADSVAPTIGSPELASRRSYATDETFPEVVIPITDRGCGVDAEWTEVYIDGIKQIARWDGFSEKVFVILRDENIIGEHDLSIVAVDRLGNSTRLVTQLHVPPPHGGKGGGR